MVSLSLSLCLSVFIINKNIYWRPLCLSLETDTERGDRNVVFEVLMPIYRERQREELKDFWGFGWF